MEAFKSSAEQTLLHPLEVWRDHQEQVSIELNQLAHGHAERSGGLLTLLPNDPDTYKAQRITEPFIDSTPDTLEEVIGTASLAERHYPAMLESLLKSEMETSEIAHLGEDLAAGQNIIIVTNHGEIKDIAIVLAAYHAAIRQVGMNTGRDYNFSTGIMISKMIAHLGAVGEPAVDILGKMCDRQYLSFPKTDSIKHSRISPLLVDAYNGSLRGLVRHQLRQGGNLLAIAPSGTIDKALDVNQPDKLSLAPVGKGTTKILTRDNTKVLPVATWLRDDEPVFEPLGIPRSLKGKDDDTSEQQVHVTMQTIATVLNMEVTNKSFTYNPPN